MLASFVAWWIARMMELFPWLRLDTADRMADAVVVEADRAGLLTGFVRRKGQEAPQTLGIVARMAAGRPVLLRVSSSAVLEKRHVVPTAPRRDLEPLLHHELGRITPFPAASLFWRWDGRVTPTDKARTEVTITMVPRMAVASALDQLAALGIRPRFLEVGPRERPKLLPVEAADSRRSNRERLAGVLRWTCAGLACVALALPFLSQAVALYTTDSAIEALGPSVAQVQALRRGSLAEGAGRDVLAQETARTGDLLQVLATITRILPDDTFLTDFSLRTRHLAIAGRSASAPQLITGLSADPAIRSAAFAAPVTRIEGTTVDVFSIQGEVVQ
jgi:general secretion pathway protein L